MADFFFYGTLCHAPLLETVLGRSVDSRPGQLTDHAVFWAEGESFPLIVEQPGGTADGILVRGMTEVDIARLDFYEGTFAYHTRDLALADGTIARVYFPDPGHWQPGRPWQLADWVAARGAVVTATAADFMALYGEKPAEAILPRYGQMLVHGASRLRAGTVKPSTLRREPAPGDIVIEARRQPYANYFAVEEYDLRHRRFDGTMSEPLNRAGFISGDAATVLPYDPVRDRVMVVEQVRIGPLMRGDANPWLLEAIAGRVDPFETPEECARREAHEEAGLELHDLIEIANYYPSPGAKTEYLYSYLALCDLPGVESGLGGLATEAEDIRNHVIPFNRLMEILFQPECANGPLILSALWLAANRDRLRKAA